MLLCRMAMNAMVATPLLLMEAVLCWELLARRCVGHLVEGIESRCVGERVLAQCIL